MNLATIFMHNFLQPGVDDPALLMATHAPRTQTVYLLISQWEELFKYEYNEHGAMVSIDRLLEFDNMTEEEFKVDTTMGSAPRVSQVGDLLDLDFGESEVTGGHVLIADAVPLASGISSPTTINNDIAGNMHV